MTFSRATGHRRISRRTVPAPDPQPRGIPNRPGRHRFLEWDDYRVEREWRRYEGTPLRDLYRDLRERFLARHRPSQRGRSLEIGPGPGRFTRLIGHPEDRVVLLELSRAMLERIRLEKGERGPPSLDLVQGDAVTPPFRPGAFHQVAMLGNVLGFAESDAPALLARTAELVGPSGALLLEFVAGSGERSRYLHRLPPGAIARLLAAPLRAVEPRVQREGFEPVGGRETGRRHFRRFTSSEIDSRLRLAGFELREVIAVAPCLGNDASRLMAARTSPEAWSRLLDLEEAIGREPARQTRAAAILVAAERTLV